ncbi:hypothetical protein HII36_14320 [Nonomuraea sp. NN258]|uniref:hypothetical protein n=1 Tax=Nonomuraea antri TaxID=2730852 RepID=UPI001568AF8D|nr:hypothetical protein [Nonomuraea antri]NRQ33007.1 hypothetical protein [Nonomuraea antri]
MEALRKALGALSLLYALIFFGAALLHGGLELGPLREPVTVPAVVVEIVCGTSMIAGAYGALTERPRAWDGLLYAHAVALGGVLLGILALAFGAGESTAFSTWYHNLIATALAAGLAGIFYVSRVRR